MDKVISSNKFFQPVDPILRQYKAPCRIIAIWAIKNFTAHKILNLCIRVSSNSYRYHTTSNFEQLIEKEESSKIPSIITTPILITISIYIGPTEFLKGDPPKVLFDIEVKILEELVIVKEIWAKLIFGRYVGPDWGNHRKFEAVCTANYKDSMIEAEEKNPKAKAKQLKNEKKQ